MITLVEFSTALLHVFEGCRLKAYRDSGGVATIGFGSTLNVTDGMEITMEQALKLFERDCAPLLKLVEGKPLLEAAALVSFGYNCGAGALKRVLAGTSDRTTFVKDKKGNTLPGLVSRRRLETALIEASKN